jgi:hypothetical protein
MKMAEEIPREKWPPFPEKTHVEFIYEDNNDANTERSTYYWAGIGTYPDEETWYGVDMVITGDDIENDNPDYNYVRLTPHVILKSNGDYIAIVLEATDSEDELEFWTYRRYNENPQWQFEGYVDKDTAYQYIIYFDSADDYYITYRSYPSGTLYQVRSGDMGGRESEIQCFLEHYIATGSPGEHDNSLWERFVLLDSDGSGEWWNQDPNEIENYPLEEYTWLMMGYYRDMVTASFY